MAEYSHIHHTFEPVYDEKSKILILGSLPSVKSREEGFYYGHPRNRFWKVITAVVKMQKNNNYNTNNTESLTIKDKKQLLLSNGIAIWDVIESCDIKGSSDSSIKNAKANDIERILKNSNIKRIYANGKTAGNLYRKYIFPKLKIDIIDLPSTSPANAAYSLEKLIAEWKNIFVE